MVNYNKSLVSPSVLLKMGSWRQPVFMVDRIVDFVPGDKGYITVIKHVTFNEPYIPGHFPDNPVMPGVMISEIFGQASEYFSLMCDYCESYETETHKSLKKFNEISQALTHPDELERILSARRRVIGFLTSQDLKFKHIVYPGDTIEATCRLANADINGFLHYDVVARVGRHIACAGRIVNFRMDRERAEKQGMFMYS